MLQSSRLQLNAARRSGLHRSFANRTSLTARPNYRVTTIRPVTTTSEDDVDTGHITAGPNEGILFFDNVFPLRVQRFMRLPFMSQQKTPRMLNHLLGPNFTGTDPAAVMQRASEKYNISVKPSQTILRLKEGGAYVKFSHDGSVPITEVEKTIKQFLEEENIKPWWSPFRKMRAGIVKGRPWVEDLFRLPTSRIKVEFIPSEPGAEAVELSQEQLYAFFRPYGKLGDIQSQPPDSKIVPRYAYLDFATIPRATMAKNCMHGYTVTQAEGGGSKGTVLRLSYEQKIKAHWIRDWFLNHPRIVIPLVAALVAGITVAVFDPIRTWFIKAHITRSLHLEDNRFYNIVKGFVTDIVPWHHHDDEDTGMEAVWDDRKTNIEQIQTWLMETAETFIIVQGPRGTGKRDLVVNQALKDKKNNLVIDCKPIQEARGDGATISAAAAAVGYRPVFSWMNSISGMIDMAAQGATGVKTGFSETLDSQLTKIFNNTAAALRQIALETRRKEDKDASLADDEWLEAHPERRPVVVIDNFLHKSHEGGIFYDKIADWGARLTTANIAHVVFLTNDVSFSKSLSKALPDRVFRQISLGDCSPEVAKKFVVTHLDADVEDDPRPDDAKPAPPPSKTRDDLAELDTCIDLLGGRLTDLEFLARRIKTGETPTKAVNEIIDQSASEILKMYIFNSDEGDSTRSWTSEQAWLLIKSLAEKGSLKYNEILLSDTYKTRGESVLRALEQAELITIVSGPNGRPSSIKPGKPVYHSAFQRLVEDGVLKAKLDLAILADLTKIETASIEKAEGELKVLAELYRENKQPAKLNGRIEYLMEKVRSSQGKIERWEEEGGVLKGVLRGEF
ncbi:hypothetical protein M011DRAFT_481216 [Sporormia fimetaria CBS 119925]|uniref:Mitochondrial escape protein 2 n=1 Tax=Sporormia fimetaria CBS 119925 TaxID=1340428 RepID=A0A6A6V0Q7_9PLEO|nr:hypothetical protein M011DRAFT_481216 [Sporormia fimetaria CBS 119925]